MNIMFFSLIVINFNSLLVNREYVCNGFGIENICDL